MKTALFLAALSVLSTQAAHADFALAANGKTVHCSADDNQSWVLNKARKTIKYTVEGESLGARPIFNKETDGKTFVSFSTDEGTLTLSDKGDTYQFAEEDQAWGVDCE
jgi:hypothetical protein